MIKKTCAPLLAGIIALTISMTACQAPTNQTDPNNQNTVNSSQQESNKNPENESYQSVTITVDLDRSGTGEKFEQTFEKPPERLVAIGYQVADILYDLGLGDRVVGVCAMSGAPVHKFPEHDSIPKIWNGGWRDISKEDMLTVSPDFMIGWDSTFGQDYFNKDFCMKNGIKIYTPYCCSDKSTFEDLYKDYETLGKIFQVEDVATQKINEMKKKVSEVKEALGDDAFKNPISIFNYDSGEGEQFTACQGMPGDIFKLAGGISLFDDIDKAWATVSWEQVVERNPQAIIVNEYTPGEAKEKIDFLYNNKNLENVDAIKNKKVFAIYLDDLEGSCGSADAVVQIAKNLYPEKFNK